MPIDGTCVKCGKAFRYPPSHPQRYCSKACANGRDMLPIEQRTAICQVCHKTFSWTGQGDRTHTYCSHACKVESQRVEWIAHTCEWCGKDFTYTPSRKPARYCSLACSAQGTAKRYRDAHGGNDYVKLGQYAWRKLRKVVLERDKACVDCGKTADQTSTGYLHVHHVIPLRNFDQTNYHEAHALSNLITLCDSCHALRDHGAFTTYGTSM